MAGLTASVVTDSAGRVLLELRSPSGAGPGLWSIPAGAVANHGSASVLLSDLPKHSDRGFFAADEIPEETSLETLLAVLNSLSWRHGALHSSDVTDRIFSALFYSHLWPVLAKTWPSAGAGTSLQWTIRNIPFRKFKSAIPFLLTASDPRSIVPALTAELMFALFYLLDDVIDQRTHRYGRQTALGARGPAETATAIMVGLTQIDGWLALMQASDCICGVVKAGSRELAEEQILRRGVGARTMEEYAGHSMRRTRFLGDLWAAACQESACEAEAVLVGRIYGMCALAGQIKNDLRDIRTIDQEERFRDIRDGVRNVCVLRLLNVADPRECERILRYLSDGAMIDTDGEAELVRLFSKHCVDVWAINEVRSLSERILAAVDEADIVAAKKCVLSEWVRMQFTSGLGAECDDSMARVGTLLDAVARLTDKL